VFTFVHAADLHLDSPLKGLEQYEGAPVDEIREATRRSLRNVVQLAIERHVDFVLLAGDLYDGDWKDYHTGLFFVAQMAQLREAGIPVVAISGNHDAANKMTKSLRLPDNVELLSATRPKTATSPRLEQLGVAVHGRSFAKAAEFDNLALAYPEKRAGMFNIGLLHTSLSGIEGHEPYAPCTIDDLRNKGYDYWALGHVHQKLIVCREPCVVFPGNTQGRHIRETGVKGCYLVHVDDRHRVELEFIVTDVFRWERCVIAAAGAKSGEEILESFHAALAQLIAAHTSTPLGVRIDVTGACGAHEQLVTDAAHWVEQLRALALDVGGGSVWVEKVRFHTEPDQAVDTAALADGPLGELLEYLQELRADESQLAGLAGELAELKKKLPDDVLRGDEALALGDPRWLRDMLQSVEPLVIGRLREGQRR
jgi:DNA repair protein SbcD/Mre11